MRVLYCARGHNTNALYASTICINDMTLGFSKHEKKRDLRKVPLKNPVAGLRGVMVANETGSALSGQILNLVLSCWI